MEPFLSLCRSSGLVPISRMVRTGLLSDLLGVAVIWVTLRLLSPLLGLAISSNFPTSWRRRPGTRRAGRVVLTSIETRFILGRAERTTPRGSRR